MPPTAPRNVLSYVSHRHAQLTGACDAITESLELHEPATPATAAEALDHFAFVIAVSVPELVNGWFQTHTRSCYQECRFLLANSQGSNNQSLVPLEPLLLRDLHLFEKVAMIQSGMPDDLKRIASHTPAGTWQQVLELDTHRYRLALPPSILYAWQDEWRTVLMGVHEEYGYGVAPPPSAVASLDARIATVEETVGGLRSHMRAAAAALSATEQLTDK